MTLSKWRELLASQEHLRQAKRHLEQAKETLKRNRKKKAIGEMPEDVPRAVQRAQE